MKALVIIPAAFLGLWCGILDAAGAEIIAQWTFNGSILPSQGIGTASLIGGTTASFATGSTNDPSSTGNTGWNTTQYPPQGVGNKTAGVQFAVSTSGYSEIVVRWDHRVSGSASKYCRLQYAADGRNFSDLSGVVCATQVSPSASFYEPQSIDLSGVPGLDDNPDFAFRIVSEFESTALGFGAEEYVTTYGTNRYSSAGTIRFDVVTVAGNPILGSNLPPTISALQDQTLQLGHTTGLLHFTVSDAEDPPEHLLVTASSSSPSVIPESKIVLSGAGRDRTVRVTAGDQPGQATITLRVKDSGGRSGTTRFLVTVLPANTPPMISGIPGTNLVVNGNMAVAVPFTVADLETAAENLSVSGQSGNPWIIPNDPAHISFGGTGSNRFLVLAPLSGAAGTARITVKVSDAVNSTATSFPLAVTPAPACVLFEPFNYVNGSVVTNSGMLWTNRSGTRGDCEVADGQLRLSSSRTEDVIVPLPGAPYEPGRGHVLYASFRFKFLGQPNFPPEYFAHFFGAGSSRARIYAGPLEVWPGAFRLYIANGSSTYNQHAAVLSSNTCYTVVARYNVDQAASALWVNPASEATPAAIAADAQTPVSITAFGFRQESALGTTVLIDDLKVGLSFAAVTTSSIPAVRLQIQPANAATVICWSDSSYTLQRGPEPGGPFTNITGAFSPFTNRSTNTKQFFRLVRSP